MLHTAPGDPKRSLRASALALSAVIVGLASGGCDVLDLRADPPVIEYRVGPAVDGIRISARVEGWTGATAWIGFGAGEVADGVSARRISGVSASDSRGLALPTALAGLEAWRVDVGRAASWQLDYEVTFGALPSDLYHRASSRSARHLVLVGPEVWAGIYGQRAAIDPTPVERPLSRIREASVVFAPELLRRDWRVVAAAPEVELNRFVLEDHPFNTVFAVGPYHVEPIEETTGISAAIHRDWTLARRSAVNHARQLLRVAVRELGPPPGDPAVMLFTPFPREASPAQGVRTAGMVWDRTLILFAGTAPRLQQSNRTIREMLAIFLGHEIFHLYVPWGLPITQPLSWLSEGWANHMGRRMAESARLLSRTGAERALRAAHDEYIRLGGARAGSLRDAAEAGEGSRELLYVRGELVFRVLSLAWQSAGHRESFDAALWRRLREISDGERPLEPEQVTEVLSSMVDPVLVRRIVDGSAPITLPELELARR